MADKRSVFPEGAPRTPGTWLDAESAERLLRGESLDNAVDAAASHEAERRAGNL